MNYTEAFKALDYDVAAPLSDWSVARPDGVCLSLWASEVKWDKIHKRSWIDTRLHAQPLDSWIAKPGNVRRIAHLAQAMAQHQGFVDVILVGGNPADPKRRVGETAVPWDVVSRGGKWRVVEFDPRTGHMLAIVERI